MKNFDEDGGFLDGRDTCCSHCGTPNYRQGYVPGICAPCLSGDYGAELQADDAAMRLYGVHRRDMGLVR